MFVSVGYELLKEKQEDRRRLASASRLQVQQAEAPRSQQVERETVADSLSEKIDF